MVLRLPDDYRIDPEDPRAPSQETWDLMSPEQRARVVAMLPSEFTLGVALNEALASKEDAERRAQAEAERASLLEKELAEARAELDRLRRAKDPPG